MRGARAIAGVRALYRLGARGTRATTNMTFRSTSFYNFIHTARLNTQSHLIMLYLSLAPLTQSLSLSLSCDLQLEYRELLIFSCSVSYIHIYTPTTISNLTSLLFACVIAWVCAERKKNVVKSTGQFFLLFFRSKNNIKKFKLLLLFFC